MSIGEVLERCLQKPQELRTQSDKNRAARCLRFLGWDSYPERQGARLEWRYRIAGEYSMSITHCRPQQQTLSIRISASLREFLELAREFITDNRAESVSISDVAKLLLESAKQDRLEAAELQQSAIAALLRVPSKWEQRQPLSRAE